MPKIRFYHIRTLFWTYLVWAVLMLLFACLLCIRTNCPLTRMPLVWVWLHITPLLSLAISWHGITDLVIAAVATGVAGLAIVSGLLINRWWARFLVIIGMSIWVLWGMCVAGIAV